MLPIAASVLKYSPLGYLESFGEFLAGTGLGLWILAKCLKGEIEVSMSNYILLVV